MSGARKSCASCGAAPHGGLQECSACCAVSYCGPECQQAHRTTHKKRCKATGSAHFKIMIAAAKAGDVGAQCSVGSAFAHGLGVSKDLNDAARWYRRAAEAGNAQAQCNLGTCYARGEGVAKNAELAAMRFRRAGAGGLVDAA